MTIPKTIRDYLEKEKVGYQILEHGLAFTASEVAGAQHVPGRQMLKSVIVKADEQFVLCLLPAIHNLDLEKLKSHLSASQARLAEEEEMSRLFPDCEIGAEPPFGALYRIPVYADKFLEEENDVAFNAGTHTDLIKMKFKDLERLCAFEFLDFGVHI